MATCGNCMEVGALGHVQRSCFTLFFVRLPSTGAYEEARKQTLAPGARRCLPFCETAVRSALS